MFTSAREFLRNHLDLSDLPLAVAQIERVELALGEISEAGTSQDYGRGAFQGASAQRMQLQMALRSDMSRIAAIAKVLDPAEYPGAAERFRVSGTKSYTALQSRARAFIDAIEPMKQAFLDHGAPADFDARLADLTTALEAAGERKYRCLHRQMEGTARMEESARRGVKAVRVLNAIVRQRLKDDPELLGVWKAAQHIERPPKRGTPEQEDASQSQQAVTADLTSLACLSSPPIAQGPTSVPHR
jgi:hypothetical protein